MPSESALRDRDSAGFALIETLGFYPGKGFVRLERHLARLRNSAKVLGFSLDENAISNALNAISSENSPLRVRIQAEQDGKFQLTSQSFTPTPPDTVWNIKIAQTRLASNDPLLRHKTTKREAYDQARAEFSTEEAHEVLLLNEDGELCEGTITSLFLDMGDGILKTPPLEAGLLAGVLRGELIETGHAFETELRPDDLASATQIYIGNSLRGLIRARLA
ncbi:aminotransferase class IV family protein [Mesorhizobium sp. SB112]|uniref:aminotransferase class IV family protein n=1 Tax=Mesorhizobium sp. SB112 TaxID=3151853 RepID=UPI003267E1BF